MDNTRRILLGKIATAHGIKGQVKILFYGDDVSLLQSASIFTDETSSAPLGFKITSQSGKYFLATIKGVTDRNAAETLQGTELYINRADMPETDEGEYYYEDLVGLPAQDETGKTIGTIKAVQNFGAGDLLEIQPALGGETFFLPFNDATVPAITETYITIVLPEKITATEE